VVGECTGGSDGSIGVRIDRVDGCDGSRLVGGCP
jgi:hypothetical protein